MELVLENIYCWFNGFFGEYLERYLTGEDCDGVYSNANLFNTIGFWTIGITLAMVILYYYIINHPGFCRWWHWLIVLVVTGCVNLLFGYRWTISALNNGEIPECFVYERDVDNEIVSQLIWSSDCWGFGIANMIVSMLFFVLFSFSLRWWSRNAKHSPCL